jgi:hypothetical protein
MFERLCKTSSDINEHLEAIRDITKECSSVVEMGVRTCVSTWAFVEGLQNGGTLISIDIKHPSAYGGDITIVEEACRNKGINFTFMLGDSLVIDIPKVDLLFIDTLHTYEQLKGEFARHTKKAQKYIVLHDTTSCPEMWVAVEELLEAKEWKIKIRYTHNNGLTILSK